MDEPEHDVIVVGAGNAALCAALSAGEHGASVVVLECAPEAEAGGNSRFAGGVMRFAFDGVDDLRKVAELTDEEVAGADFGTYTRAQYFDDLFRLTQYRTDPTLVELLVTRSLDTMIWLRGQGARFVPIYGRQAGKVGGRWKFFGGLPIEASGGGAGLVQSLTAAARRRAPAPRRGAESPLIAYGDPGGDVPAAEAHAAQQRGRALPDGRRPAGAGSKFSTRRGPCRSCGTVCA